MSEPWTDEKIREGFIYDGGESEYHDPEHGARTQRKIAGDIFDAWIAEHDARVRAEERSGIIADLIGPETRLEASVRAFKQGWHLADTQGRSGDRVAEGLRTVVADRIEYLRGE